jgi:hypothetical protein
MKKILQECYSAFELQPDGAGGIPEWAEDSEFSIQDASL